MIISSDLLIYRATNFQYHRGRGGGGKEICFVADVQDVLTGVVNTCKTNLTVMQQFKSTATLPNSQVMCSATPVFNGL